MGAPSHEFDFCPCSRYTMPKVDQMSNKVTRARQFVPLLWVLTGTLVSGCLPDNGCKSATHTKCVEYESGAHWLRSGMWSGEYSVGCYYLGFDDDLKMILDSEGVGEIRVERNDWPHSWFWNDALMIGRGGWDGKSYVFKTSYDSTETWLFRGDSYLKLGGGGITLKGALYSNGDKIGSWDVFRPYKGCIKTKSYTEVLCEPSFDESQNTPASNSQDSTSSTTYTDPSTDNTPVTQTANLSPTTTTNPATPTTLQTRLPLRYEVQADYQSRQITVTGGLLPGKAWQFHLVSLTDPGQVVNFWAGNGKSKTVSLPGTGPWLLQGTAQLRDGQSVTANTQLSPWLDP